MGFALLGLKFIPMILKAVISTEDRSTKKGPAKQDEAIQLLSQILTISQGVGTKPDAEVLRDAEPEARVLIDALVAFLNAAKTSEGSPTALQ
jgi:hypothetical protein